MADATAPPIGGQPVGDERRREGLRRRERETENEWKGRNEFIYIF